ncbi:unnamed protein product, partial [Ilex paraguariensis]
SYAGLTHDGLLQCALSDPDGIEVWVLKKKTSQYSLSSIIPRTEWVLTYALNPEDFLLPVSDTKSVKLGSFSVSNLLLLVFHNVLLCQVSILKIHGLSIFDWIL